MREITLPDNLLRIRDEAQKAIIPIRPVDGNTSARSDFLSSPQSTNASKNLPPYYLVYFLLVDLLGFQNIGRGEKIAWSVPIDFNGRAFLIEHRKFGIEICVQDSNVDGLLAERISSLINKGVRTAEPFFDWLAEQAVGQSELNVQNFSLPLFERFEYFMGLYRLTDEQAKENVNKKSGENKPLFKYYNIQNKLRRNARWLALATVDAFFSWTEHIFIHLAIISGKTMSGIEVSDLSEKNWPEKFKNAISLDDPKMKHFYDELSIIRRQLRNFVSHGAFGKQGEAFSFHSNAGAVPVLLPHKVNQRRFSLTESFAFEEADAIKTIEEFIQHLWTGERVPANLYIQESGLPLILTMAKDGTYSKAMRSYENMEALVKHLSYLEEQSINMDF